VSRDKGQTAVIFHLEKLKGINSTNSLPGARVQAAADFDIMTKDGVRICAAARFLSELAARILESSGTSDADPLTRVLAQ
jgi:hypothetical protein